MTHEQRPDGNVTAPAPLSCPKCRADLPADLPPPGVPAACPSCRRPVEGLIFPAYRRPPATGKAAEAVVAAEDAGCFYHPQSRATVPCDQCGRFLCALCDLEIGGRHLCPGCVNAGRKKKLMSHLDDGRVLYGRLALMVALLPLLFWPLTVVTGPAAVFLAIYGWKKPRSLTGGGRVSYVFAILIGLAETLGWLFLVVKIFR